MKANANKTVVTIENVRNVNKKAKENLNTLGGCISAILTLDKKGLETQETKLIDFLIKCKKDTNTYKKLSERVKPHFKSGNFNKYSVLIACKAILNA